MEKNKNKWFYFNKVGKNLILNILVQTGVKMNNNRGKNEQFLKICIYVNISPFYQCSIGNMLKQSEVRSIDHVSS